MRAKSQAPLATALLVLCCSHEGGGVTRGSATPSSPPAPAASGSLQSEPAPAPTADPASSGFLDLAVPGFLSAVVYVPSATEPRPVVVANHGAGGIPEAECDYWRRLTRGHAFLLCLRGTPLGTRAQGGFYYKDHLALGREFSAAERALRERFGQRLLTTGGIYAGFSQGAIMGAPMIVPHARAFSRLALIEGGYEYWSVATARSFAKNGGQRVLFVCGTRWCAEKAEIPADWLRNAKVAVRIEYAPGAGHTPGGEVMSKTAAALPWLLEGDRSWNL